MRTNIKLTFKGEDKFFGPGVASLLKEIDKCGNVREACENCGFSYSKGWTIIKKSEDQLGEKIVRRQVGGANGGEASVTDTGRALLAVYEKLLAELKEHAEERFIQLSAEYGIKTDDCSGHQE